MKLRVQKVGEALGVILPATVLEVLQLREGDMLHLTQNDWGFQLSAANGELEAQLAVASKLLARYGATLRELAK